MNYEWQDSCYQQYTQIVSQKRHNPTIIEENFIQNFKYWSENGVAGGVNIVCDSDSDMQLWPHQQEQRW